MQKIIQTIIFSRQNVPHTLTRPRVFDKVLDFLFVSHDISGKSLVDQWVVLKLIDARSQIL